MDAVVWKKITVFVNRLSNCLILGWMMGAMIIEVHYFNEILAIILAVLSYRQFRETKKSVEPYIILLGELYLNNTSFKSGTEKMVGQLAIIAKFTQSVTSEIPWKLMEEMWYYALIDIGYLLGWLSALISLHFGLMIFLVLLYLKYHLQKIENVDPKDIDIDRFIQGLSIADNYKNSFLDFLKITISSQESPHVILPNSSDERS